MKNHGRPLVKLSWAAGAFAFVAMAASALAQVHAAHPVTPVAPPRSSAAPLPSMSMRPVALPSATLAPYRFKKHYVHAVAPGTRVPLSELPPVPIKTAMNTVIPGKHGGGHRMHPMAATGVTFAITPAGTCATGGTEGQLFNVGCQLTLEATGVNGWNSTDTYQYYVVPPNSTTATAFAGSATWVPAGCPATCTGTSYAGTSALLSSPGTYAFLVYDTTAQVIASSVYLNAGPVVTIGLFQDGFHSSPAYQFDTSSSTAVYIYATNLSDSDKYVVYVNSTGVNTYCVYMTPTVTPTPLPPSPRPTGPVANLICNPNLPSGNTPVAGNLSLQWPLNTSYESGSYEVVLYDQSANNGTGETVASVQLSLTGVGGIALLTYGGTPAPNPSAGPNAPVSTTVVSWDSTNDQAVAGITGTSNGTIPAGNYVWSISDPDGRVVSTTAVTLGAAGTLSHPFVFSALGLSQPGQYPSVNWVMQLYNSSTKSVVGSQSFQIYGYSSETEFNQSGVLSTSLNIPCTTCSNTAAVFTPPPTGLRITNTGNSVFLGAGDSWGQGTHASIAYTTATIGSANAFATPPPNTGNTGVYVTLGAAGTAVSACHPSCSVTVPDSNGNSWTVTDYCSAATVSAVGACSLFYAPVSAGTVLPPGSYVEIPAADMTWYAEAGNNNTPWPCYAVPCGTATSVLPTHGLAWSSTATTSPAWTTATIGSTGQTLSGTAVLTIAGSCTLGTGTCTGADTTAPFAGTHWYALNFLNGDYQNSTPFQAGTNRADIMGIKITNTSGTGNFTQLAIGFPAYFTVSSVQVDPNLNGTGTGAASWQKETCPSGLGPLFFCVTTKGAYGGIPNTGTNIGFLFLDVPPTVAAFAFNEFIVEGFDSNEFTWATASGGTITAAPFCGGGTTCTGAFSPLDGLGYASYSLNSNLVGASFEPSTVGTGTNPTPLSLVVTNTSTAADPNPDAIDAIVVQQLNGSTAGWQIAGTPTVTGPTGWSSPSGTGYSPAAGSFQYWFDLTACGAAQYANHATLGGGPPTPPPNPANPAASLGATTSQVTPCTAAQEENALASGESATLNFSLNQAMTAGTYTFYVYVHGANGGGWSQPKPVTLTVSSESAKVNFFSVQSPTGGTTTTVTNGNVATISDTPNTFVYEITNTSNTADIGTVDLTLPAFDINGQKAEDTNGNSWQLVGSPITTNIVVGTISGGVFTAVGKPAGCAVNAANTVNPSPGVTNGKIEISGCTLGPTGLAPGKILAVEFQASAPQTESDSYLFPTTLDGSFTAGLSWVGSDEVTTTFAIGLSLVVSPTNPGPGASDPQVSCSQCAFSGSTIDFGPIFNPPTVPNTITGTDVVRASVIYGGTSNPGHSWGLTMSASNNPMCVGCAINSELLYDVEPQNPAGTSQTGCTAGSITVAAAQQIMAAVSTGSSAVATGSETTCTTFRANATGPDYDVIQSFKVQVGTESPNGQVIVLTYTLIAS
jgi:hypothetical protein